MSIFQAPTQCELTRLACDPTCHCDTCQESKRSIRMRSNKQLYCRAFSVYDEGSKSWIGDKEYTHADTIEEAR
jgi:hypothetical protein